MIYYTENYKDKTPQHQVFNVAKQISQAIKELSLLEIILEEIGKQIKAELGFEFVNISLVVPEQGTIESVYGTGIAEKLTDLAKHYLEKDKALRDIQADIFQTRRTEVISGEDERFDPWIYETFNHERLVRVFTPIILVRDESGNVREDWFDRCQWKKPIEKNGKRQHTVFEMQLPNEFPDEAIQVIGTVEAGYHSNQKQIDDKQVKALVKLVARRTFDIRKAQLPYVLETIAEDARQILQADLATLHFLYEPQQSCYIYEVCTGSISHLLLRRFPPRRDGLGWQAIREGKPKFISNDFQDDDNLELKYFNSKAWEEGTRAYAAFPLLFDSQQKIIDGASTVTDENDMSQECPTFVGVLYVHHFQHEHRFTQEEQRWGEFLAQQAVSAIQQAIILEQERKRKRQFAVLQSVAESLSNLSNMPDKKDELLRQIAWHTLNILAADVVTIYEYAQTEEQFLEPKIAGRLKDENETRRKKKIDDNNAPSLLVKHGCNQYASRLSEKSIFNNSTFANRESIKSAAGILLKVSDGIIGVMFINYRRPHGFSSNEQKIIETLANSAAVAIKTQRNLKIANKMQRNSEIAIELSKILIPSSDVIRGDATKEKVYELLEQVKSQPENPDQEPEHKIDKVEKGNSNARLNRVILENIGPFDNLQLKLDTNWNFLLGENGVGKTYILKAIATAICGKDAQLYATQLLKIGKNSGSITLETENNTYKTEICKTHSSSIEFSTKPNGFLEIEGILVLGFSPLRTIIWESRTSGEISRNVPTSEDVFPLVTGGPDARIPKLKQWIVDLESRSRIQKLKTGSGGRNEKVLDDFFKVVESLLEGLRIEPGTVKPEKNEVTVITDDGELPIEALSQGFISLISWVGILLQRLYEIYDEYEDPKLGYALVLIDEIDSHLHPVWQQTLVHTLSKIFPNVQFLATTYSPLVIAGMPAEQIFCFTRDEEGKVIQVKIESDMTMGRADQILTGELFGLKTTLDLVTQEKLEEYKSLLGKRSRTPEEEERFQELRHTLNLRIPLPYETPSERKEQAKAQTILLLQALSAVIDNDK